VRYTLTPRAAVARARALAASETAMVVLPAWLVVVLVAQLGLAARAMTLAVAAAIAALGAVRGALAYARAKRRLAGMAIDDDGDGLTFHGPRTEARVPSSAIARAVEIDGPYGGLRLELASESLPARMDVPRGGESFGDLRARIAAWAPIERAPRRGWPSRLALGAVVVLALFFVPFVVADARGSRVAVAVLLLAAWGATRLLAMRS
jgi:hypothetical protein